MKRFNLLIGAVASAVALGLAGCGKKESPADATQPLQESFQAAEPQVQETIASVTASLKARNYAEATRTVAPIVTARRLTDPQKQAVSVMLQQINQAVEADPSLDTKEMYEMRVKMYEALHRGPRF